LGRTLSVATTLCLLLFALASEASAGQAQASALVPKFKLEKSGLELERRVQAGAFMDVLGRKSALYGYERRSLEAWVYPLQILDQFELSFRLEGYPLEFGGADTATLINVRPEATTVTYTHAAFTVRQIIFAPVGEPGIVMLLEVESALPLGVTVSFRPRLKLMWPAGLMTASLGWDEDEKFFYLHEESRRFAGIVGSPAARDASTMPYQEEPRDVPARFRIEVPPESLKGNFIPVVIAGGVRGVEEAKATYARLLRAAPELYAQNVEHYRQLLGGTASIRTPDERLNEAFEWAKVGIDKGVVENPLLGTGLVAGFRTAGESERPGFAWFFGRDALWTTFALNSYGDFGSARAALDFLKKYQRADGKIPHEISQSASLVPWFTDYEYPWASADATPLYIIAHADYLRASGDLAFVRANWDSILKAYRFTASTDADANGLVENTGAGHGWVEGGALYPPHEEIYMQGLWAEALRGMGELAAALKDERLASEARAAHVRALIALERTYWLPERGFYAFATNVPREAPRKAEPGPNRAARQARMNELDRSRLVDEDTVMPSVPMWWKSLADERAQSEIDHTGSGHMATDWGSRIVSDESRLYDPLSYHHGSVWPLFTGWASLGAYRYGRPHVGFQALMANVLLKKQNALGFVTELLSGEFNAPFGRSSHHQIWSEAMVVTPALRGLFGLETSDGGRLVRFAPQLPADWGEAEVFGYRTPAGPLNLRLARAEGRTSILVYRPGVPKVSGDFPRARLELAPALPLDARVRSVTVGGRGAKFLVTREGDVQRVTLSVELTQRADVAIIYDEGTDVYKEALAPEPGARSGGLRVLRSRADEDSLRLLVEGRGGRVYSLRVRTPREIGEAEGVKVFRPAGRDATLSFGFEGPQETYVRRELVIPLGRAK
jgi:glycogen debranching enzyme